MLMNDLMMNLSNKFTSIIMADNEKDSMKLTPAKPVTTAPPTNTQQALTPEERKRNDNIASNYISIILEYYNYILFVFFNKF